MSLTLCFASWLSGIALTVFEGDFDADYIEMFGVCVLRIAS
jgi:hypothetical protein